MDICTHMTFVRASHAEMQGGGFIVLLRES